MKPKPFSARLVLVLTILCTTVILSACGAPENQTPVIFGLSSDPASVAPGDGSTLTCTASDPDGDRLSYSWSTTGGSLSGTGNAISWTAPDTPGTYSISVTVTDGKGGTADKSHTITVVAKAVVANRPPVIERLSADPRTVEPQARTTITCVATDPDGDPLTYTWWAELGYIEGKGNTVTWAAPPQTGEYVIEVWVRDSKGEGVTKSRKVTVAINESPKITSVSAKQTSVIVDRSTTITCKAEDPDGDPLTYTWSADWGSISGTEEVVTWTAPGRVGNFTIKVKIDDSRGGTDTSSVTVQVQGEKITRVLKPLSSESGCIYSATIVYPGWRAGDNNANDGIRAYLSFDISGITEVEEFRSAVLNISTFDQIGTPWADLGSLNVDEVEYGARPIRTADYDLSGTRLLRVDSPPITEIDLTPIISRAVRDGVPRFQIMFYFQTETDDDNISDNIKVTNAELTVHYVQRT